MSFSAEAHEFGYEIDYAAGSWAGSCHSCADASLQINPDEATHYPERKVGGGLSSTQTSPLAIVSGAHARDPSFTHGNVPAMRYSGLVGRNHRVGICSCEVFLEKMETSGLLAKSCRSN